MDTLLSHPLLPYVVGALVLLFVASRITLVGGSGPDLERLLSRVLGASYARAKLERAVARARKDGHYLMAGKLLEDADDKEAAVAAYLEGSEYNAAAAVMERMGPARQEKAADLYKQGGDYRKAAQVLASIGRQAKAAALFEEKGNNLDAAQLYAQGGAHERAAELYARAGYPLRAAESWAKLGDFTRAGEAYEKHFMENVSYGTTYAATAASPDQKSALLAGQMYEKAGALERALQAFTRGSYHRDAARVCLALQQPLKAAENFLRCDDPAAAADAYEKGGDAVKAANLRGEILLKEERTAEAAALFVAGRDFLRAAELYESKGMNAEAARAFEAAESHAAAGGAWLRGGDKVRAAAAFERAGDHETAARLCEEVGQHARAVDLYARAGQPFRAAQGAVKLGDREKAIALLQQVGADDEHHRAAAPLLCQLFVETGRHDLAVARLQKLVGQEPVSRETIDLHYWLGLAHAGAGRKAEALAAWRRVQAEDLQYRDVEARIQALERKAPAAPTAPPARPAAAPVAPPSISRPAAPPAAPAAAPAPARAAGPPGRFELQEELGRGPLGVVFRAVDRADGRSLALRRLPAELALDEHYRLLAADVRAAAQLSHPNVVKVLGLAEQEGARYVVGEYVAGRTLAEPLKGGVRSTVSQAHSIARVLAQALAAIHARGQVHGAVQPSNIMVAAGVVKLADLGLVHLLRLAPAPTPDYRAPERRYDAGGDVYALGAVVYHMLTGTHHRTHPQGVGLPLPSTFAPGVPEALDKLLLRALHPRPELRVPTAEAFFAELKDMVRIG